MTKQKSLPSNKTLPMKQALETRRYEFNWRRNQIGYRTWAPEDARYGVSESGGQDLYVGAVEPARGEEIQVALVFGSQG